MKHFNTSIEQKFLRILFLLTLAFSAEPAFGQNDSMLKFVDAVNQALEDNNGFAAQSASLEAKEKDVKIARANFLPSLGFQGSYYVAEGEKINDWDRMGLSSGTKGVLSGAIYQMIYNEQYFANHRIQKELYASQQEQFRNARYQLIASTGQAYIGVLVAEAVLDVMRIDQELTMTNLEAASYREEVGSTSEQEVLRWKTKLYKADQNIAGQKASVRVNRIALNQLRNQPEEKTEELERLIVEEDGFVFKSNLVDQVLLDESKAKILRDYLVEIGLGNSPLLGSMDAQIAAQERQLKSDKRWLIPSFDLMVGGDDQFMVVDAGDGESQSGDLFWFAGAKMSWNVFRGGSNISTVKQQKIVSQELQFQRAEVNSSQEKAIRSQASMLIADLKNVRLAKEQANVAGRNYIMVYDAYLLGEVTVLALLDAQEQKFIADYSSVVAYYTFLLDLLSLEEMIGYFPFLEPQEKEAQIIAELERRIAGE